MGTGHHRSLILSLIREDAKRRRMDVTIPGIGKDGLQNRPSANELKLPTERFGPVQANCNEVKHLFGNEG
jgi:hypothetical protein